MIRLRYDKLDVYQYNKLRKQLDDAKMYGVAKLEKMALLQYCYYLNSIGYTYPKPRYKYLEHDKTTWKYLDSSFRPDAQGRMRVTETLNPDFRYGHLK